MGIVPPGDADRARTDLAGGGRDDGAGGLGLRPRTGHVAVRQADEADRIGRQAKLGGSGARFLFAQRTAAPAAGNDANRDASRRRR